MHPYVQVKCALDCSSDRLTSTQTLPLIPVLSICWHLCKVHWPRGRRERVCLCVLVLKGTRLPTLFSQDCFMSFLFHSSACIIFSIPCPEGNRCTKFVLFNWTMVAMGSWKVKFHSAWWILQAKVCYRGRGKPGSQSLCQGARGWTDGDFKGGLW